MLIIMIPEYTLESDNIRNIVKLLTNFEGKTLTQMKMAVNTKYSKNDSLENLTNKLRNKTIKVTELLQILDVLGYETIIRKRV